MLNPLYFAVSWVLLKWHALWAMAFGDGSGVSWALSIAFLVMTVRLILFPLFVKQIHSQRAMQELQPKFKALKEKYKGDKEALQRETMAMYKEHGANPVAGCLPIVLQGPVFLALFHVLRRLNPHPGATKTLYGWSADLFDSASHASLFGAPIAAHFNMSAANLAKLNPDASTTTVKLVNGALIAIMVVTTYITQRQMITRQAASGQAVDQQQQMVQRLMLYGVPVSLLVSGSLFPLGVVIYWCTTNLWSMGQQFYVLRKMPHPGAKPERPEDPQVAAAAARTLAPRPGARPSTANKSRISPKAGRVAGATTSPDGSGPGPSDLSGPHPSGPHPSEQDSSEPVSAGTGKTASPDRSSTRAGGRPAGQEAVRQGKRQKAQHQKPGADQPMRGGKSAGQPVPNGKPSTRKSAVPRVPARQRTTQRDDGTGTAPGQTTRAAEAGRSGAPRKPERR